MSASTCYSGKGAAMNWELIVANPLRLKLKKWLRDRGQITSEHELVRAMPMEQPRTLIRFYDPTEKLTQDDFYKAGALVAREIKEKHAARR